MVRAGWERQLPSGLTCNYMYIVSCQYMRYVALMALVNDRVFQMRASEEWLRKLDDWRRTQPDIPARAEAIRRLVELGLQVNAP